MKSGQTLTAVLLFVASAALGYGQGTLPPPSSNQLYLNGPILEGPVNQVDGEPTPADPREEGIEYLNRGPVHEAFATQVTSDPSSTPIIDTAPPKPVNEIPPEVQLEDENAIWIPGYWAWDEDREDYLWVSGVWRVAPENRSWMPGYWTIIKDERGIEIGHQWVSGFWAEKQQQQIVNYVAPPPASLETGPSQPAISDDHFWMPGNWVVDANAGSNYAWQPGHWHVYQPDRVWVPSHYVSTPLGCIYVSGYWDYPVVDRGHLFTPVYIDRHIVAQPNFCYRPTYVVNTPNLYQHLFVCPTSRHYYFGDYYGTAYTTRYHSHAHYHRRGFGYDPLYVHYQHHYRRRGINYGARLSSWNVHVNINLNSRPSRTVRGHRNYLANQGPNPSDHLVLVRSLAEHKAHRYGRSRNDRGNQSRGNNVVRGSSDKLSRRDPRLDSVFSGPAKNLHSSGNVGRPRPNREQPAAKAKPKLVLSENRPPRNSGKPNLTRSKTPSKTSRNETRPTLPTTRSLTESKANFIPPNRRTTPPKRQTIESKPKRVTYQPTQVKTRNENRTRPARTAVPTLTQSKASFTPPNRKSVTPTRQAKQPPVVRNPSPTRMKTPTVKPATPVVIRRPSAPTPTQAKARFVPPNRSSSTPVVRQPKPTRQPTPVVRNTPTTIRRATPKPAPQPVVTRSRPKPTPTQARASFTPPNRRRSTPTPKVTRAPQASKVNRTPPPRRTPKATPAPTVRRPQPAARAPKASAAKPKARAARPNPTRSKARFTPPGKKKR